MYGRPSTVRMLVALLEPPATVIVSTADVIVGHVRDARPERTVQMPELCTEFS